MSLSSLNNALPDIVNEKLPNASSFVFSSNTSTSCHKRSSCPVGAKIDASPVIANFPAREQLFPLSLRVAKRPLVFSGLTFDFTANGPSNVTNPSMGRVPIVVGDGSSVQLPAV
jgi:hypothetical protein